MNAWEYFLPFYFVMNKLNYARYGSYYLYEMKNKEVPVSMQGQNRYNIRILIDLRGEQILNEQAKTVGMITGFAANTNAVAKWTHCVKSVQIRSFFSSIFSPNMGKYGPEKTPCLDTFHAVTLNWSYYHAVNLTSLHKMYNLTTN